MNKLLRAFKDQCKFLFLITLILCLVLLSQFFLPRNKVKAGSSANIAWPSTDFNNSAVSLKEFSSGGPPKDGIPSIDAPKFVSFQDANNWLSEQAPVIVLSINGESKGYPLSILLWHEIINDSLGGQPIAVTYCPLCSAPICFERRLRGRVLSFGTTGMLRKSDLVMYDRQTESWWQQYTGECLLGHFKGSRLKTVSSQVTSYRLMKRLFPEAKVLSHNTGHSRNYGQSPYVGYDDERSDPFLFKDQLSIDLPKLARIVGLSAGNIQRAYRLSLFKKKNLLNDTLGSTPVLLIRSSEVHSDLDKNRIDNVTSNENRPGMNNEDQPESRLNVFLMPKIFE